MAICNKKYAYLYEYCTVHVQGVCLECKYRMKSPVVQRRYCETYSSGQPLTIREYLPRTTGKPWRTLLSRVLILNPNPKPCWLDKLGQDPGGPWRKVLLNLVPTRTRTSTKTIVRFQVEGVRILLEAATIGLPI